MIRILTLGLAVAALVLSFGLYHVKYRTEAAGNRVAELRRDIAREREHVKLLRADWSNLDNPRRLAILARRHLGFENISPRQITTFEQLVKLVPEREPDLAVYSSDALNGLLARLPDEKGAPAYDSDALTDLLIRVRGENARERGGDGAKQ